jgi:hypothetical protein
MSFENEEDGYTRVGEVGFKMTLVLTKCSLRTINSCNHNYPGMRRGIAE